MPKMIPSFRIQIVLIFFILLIISVLFTRSFFLNSFQAFLDQISLQETDNRLNHLYETYHGELSAGSKDQFKQDVEQIMVNMRQIDIATNFYRQQVKVYSVYIFIFISLAVLAIFLLSLNLITLPLKRLQEATRQLATGKEFPLVKESRFSPINDLIVSFNHMVRELEINRQRAIEAEKQLVWREVARVMAHEIKNPLTPMKLSVERLALKADRDPQSIAPILQESLSVIREEIQNLQNLVDRFRGFAMLPAARPESYDLAEQLREIVKAHENRHKIGLTIDGALPKIWADRMQLKQVFVNLIQNALQAFRNPEEELAIRADFQEGDFCLEFRDSGPGIPEEDLAKIFEPYFTTKRKGTGLGLAVVKRIIDNHAGTLSVSSYIGRGTCFKLKIPLLKENP